MDPETTPTPAPKKSHAGIVLLVIIIIILAVIAFAHKRDGEMNDDMNATEPTSQSDTSSTEPTTPPGTQVAPTVNTSTTVTIPPVASATKSFAITGSNFKFSPSAITVNKGDTVKITFVNSGGTHSLVVDGYNVSTPQIASGASSTISFVADKAGTFEYYCSVGTHRQMGMKGTLIVK